MNSLKEIRFTSRECKNGMHKDCHYAWHGLGLEFRCICECDHYKKMGMLEQQVARPARSNTFRQNQTSQQGALLDD
jgi:hypothetical protein